MATWLSWVTPASRKLSRVYWLTSGTSTWVLSCSGLRIGTWGPPVSICDHWVRVNSPAFCALVGTEPCKFTSRLASLKISGPASILKVVVGLDGCGVASPKSAAAFCSSVCVRSVTCCGVIWPLLVSTWLPWPLPQALKHRLRKRAME